MASIRAPTLTASAQRQVTGELVAAIESRMCSEKTDDAELIVLSRLGAGIPELASSKGLDCVLARHPKEDAVLWSALDAWQINKLPESDAIREVMHTAKDPRTRARLLPLEERIARRGQVEEGQAQVIASDPPPDFRPEALISKSNTNNTGGSHATR